MRIQPNRSHSDTHWRTQTWYGKQRRNESRAAKRSFSTKIDFLTSEFCEHILKDFGCYTTNWALGFLHSAFGILQSTCGRVALCCPDCARRNVRKCRLFALQPALRRHAAKNYLRENTSCRACAGIHEGPKRLQLRRTVQIVREIANVILRCYDDNQSDEIPNTSCCKQRAEHMVSCCTCSVLFGMTYICTSLCCRPSAVHVFTCAGGTATCTHNTRKP